MTSATYSHLRNTMTSVGALCVGIDPSHTSLTDWGLPDTAEGALEMGRVILEGAVGRVGIVKPQVGYFERFGSNGFAALESLISDARRAGLVVIADAKRGDIGTTMEAYAEAWLGHGPLQSDAMTVSPYQGFDALEPAFARADAHHGTVFVLAATSNPDAATVQSATHPTGSLPATISRLARLRNDGSDTVGVVVGATRTLADNGLTSADLDGLLILAPGFGAQGASLTNVSSIFGDSSSSVIPSVSRSVLSNGPTGVGGRIDAHRSELGI